MARRVCSTSPRVRTTAICCRSSAGWRCSICSAAGVMGDARLIGDSGRTEAIKVITGIGSPPTVGCWWWMPSPAFPRTAAEGSLASSDHELIDYGQVCPIVPCPGKHFAVLVSSMLDGDAGDLVLGCADPPEAEVASWRSLDSSTIEGGLPAVANLLRPPALCPLQGGGVPPGCSASRRTGNRGDQRGRRY